MRFTTDHREHLEESADILFHFNLGHHADGLRRIADELTDEAARNTRTPGQIAWEALLPDNLVMGWDEIGADEQADFERAALAVIAHHEQQPVWDERIEPTPEPESSWVPTVGAWAEHAWRGPVYLVRVRKPGEWEARLLNSTQTVWVDERNLFAPGVFL